MKKFKILNFKVLLLISIFVLTSCSKNDEDDSNFELKSKYTHLLQNCDNTTNPEVNCIEFIEFINSENANILIGGSDIVYKTNYTITNSKINFEKVEGLNYDISFNINSDTTITRIEDGELWTEE